MEILEIEIQNFLTIGHARLSLDGKGLVLIQGENMDDPSAKSNGAGKSSIPDALMWCLYGETARGIGGDAVVNEKAKKNCTVAVTLRDGASLYLVTRHRKHSEFKNTLRIQVRTDKHLEGDMATDLTRGTDRETQQVVETVLGSSKDVFQAAIYAGQEVCPDLPKMTDKQLKLLIEEAAGVDRLSKAYEVARLRVNDTERAVAIEKAKVETLKSKVGATIAARDAAQKKADEFEAGRAANRDEHLARAKDLEEKVRAHVQDIREMGDSAALRSELEGIDAKLKDHSKMRAAAGDLARAHASAEALMQRAMDAFARAHEEVVKLKKHIEDAPTSVGKPCHTCGKPHTEADVATVVANLKEQLREKAVKAKELKAAFAKTVDAHGEAKKKAEEAEAALPDVSELSDRQRVLREKAMRIEKAKSHVAMLKRDYDALKTAAATAMTESNPFIRVVEAHKEAIAKLDEEIATLTAKVEGLERSLEIAQSVAKVFSPAGVRAHILDTVTPFLNERTAEYLTILSDGHINAVWTTLAETTKGELREKFHIDVENDKGAKSFEGLSGGEKRKVRLATMLALQDLVASRATKPINIWIGDEIDDALDSAGLERLMTILERKARERGTVLVISHNELRDWIDNVIVVRKDGGFATVEGELAIAA